MMRDQSCYVVIRSQWNIYIRFCLKKLDLGSSVAAKYGLTVDLG